MINGKKIILKPISESDTANIIKWRNSDSVRKNFFIQDILTEEQHQFWLDNRIKSKEVAQFIIINKSNNTPIGSVFLRDIDNKNNKAEYGIFIGEEGFRNKGFGTEAAALICNYGFFNLNLNRIFLRVFAHNLNAIKSYENAGFKIEGILKSDICIDNNYYDVVIMGKLRNI